MGFVLHEFGTIPELPPDFSHQSNSVTLLGYLLREGDGIVPGTSVATFENWWARFDLVCNVQCTLAKNLFDSVPGVMISEGTPIVFIFIEPNNIPQDEPTFTWTVTHITREKPAHA